MCHGEDPVHNTQPDQALKNAMTLARDKIRKERQGRKLNVMLVMCRAEQLEDEILEDETIDNAIKSFRTVETVEENTKQDQEVSQGTERNSPVNEEYIAGNMVMGKRAEEEYMQTADTEEEDTLRMALRRSTNKTQAEEEIKKVMKAMKESREITNKRINESMAYEGYMGAMKDVAEAEPIPNRRWSAYKFNPEEHVADIENQLKKMRQCCNKDKIQEENQYSIINAHDDGYDRAAKAAHEYMSMLQKSNEATAQQLEDEILEDETINNAIKSFRAVEIVEENTKQDQEVSQESERNTPADEGYIAGIIAFMDNPKEQMKELEGCTEEKKRKTLCDYYN